MKASLQMGTGALVLESQTDEDLFLLGKLAAKIKDHATYKPPNGHRELRVNLDDLLKLATQ